MSIKNYLIIPQYWLGDIIMTQALAKKIKSNEKKSKIDLLVPGIYAPLTNRMPEINECMVFNCNHKSLCLSERIRMSKMLKGKYDECIILSRSLKSSIIPLLASIPIRTGEIGEYRYFIINNIKKFSKDERRKSYLRFISMYGQKEKKFDSKFYPTLASSKKNLEKISKKLNLNLNRPTVVFAPGSAYGPSKMWPKSKFISLAKRIIDENFQIWVMGNKNEKTLGDDICSSIKDVTNLCGKTNIGDAVDLINHSEYCVSNDSGLMHLAAATKTKLIGIYGSTSPSYTPPLSINKNIFYENLECSPCFKKTCRFNHYNCLNKIQEEDVAKIFK